MKLSDQWRALPTNMRVILGFFLVCPIWAFNWPERFHLHSKNISPTLIGLHIACFFILPIVNIYLGLKRSKFFLASYGLHLCGFIAMTFLSRTTGPQAMLEYLCVGTAYILGSLFFTTDNMSPFLASNSRGWRLATRLPLGLNASYKIGLAEDAQTLMVHDISLTGLKVMIANEVALSQLTPGVKMMLQFERLSFHSVLVCEVVHKSIHGKTAEVGLSCSQEQELKKIIEELAPLSEIHTGWRGMFSRLWANSERIVMIVWIASLVGTLMMRK